MSEHRLILETLLVESAPTGRYRNPLKLSWRSKDSSWPAGPGVSDSSQFASIRLDNDDILAIMIRIQGPNLLTRDWGQLASTSGDLVIRGW